MIRKRPPGSKSEFQYMYRLIALTILLFPSLLTAQVRIMALGDSITRGVEAYNFPVASHPESAYRTSNDTIPNSLRSYREHLHDLLTNTSCDADITWVGSGVLTERTPSNHEGHSGWRADQILNHISMWLVQYEPNVLLLNIGTNDLIQGNSATSTEQDIVGILDAIDEYEINYNKSVQVFIGNMVPIIGWHATHDRHGNFIDAEFQRSILTESIFNLVLTRQSVGDFINFVDINSDFYVDEGNVTNCATGASGNPANMMMTRCQSHLPPNSPDGIHPNLLGERFLAQRFSSALRTHANICSDNLTNGTEKPIASIGNPAFHDVTLAPNANFTGSAYDTGGSGLRDVLVYVRDQDNRSWYSIANPATLSNNTDSSTTWSYSTTLPAGNYALFVKARDNAGNSSTRFGRRFTVPDDQIPNITMIFPSDHDATLAPNANFTGSAYDTGGSGLKDVLVYVRDRDSQSWYSISSTATLSNHTDSSAAWSYSTTLPAGNYALFVKARDNAGNSSARFGRRFTIVNE